MKKDSPELPQIPNKKYFKIAEVSKLTKLPEYTLRYWETEFKQLKPEKSSKGHRLYLKKDLELIFQIKHLLYEKKFTIDGARKALSGKREKLEATQQLELGFEQTFLKTQLQKILKELKEIEKQLGS